MSFEFPEDKPIRSVEVCADNRIRQIRFLDRDGGEIKKILGQESGYSFIFEVPEGENLIGFRVTDGGRHALGIGFMTMKVKA